MRKPFLGVLFYIKFKPIYIMAFLVLFARFSFAIDIDRRVIEPPGCNQPALHISPKTANMVRGEKKQFYASFITQFPTSQKNAAGVDIACPDNQLKTTRAASTTPSVSTMPQFQLTQENDLGASSKALPAIRIAWTSNNSGLAKVNNNGLVTIVGNSGRAVITAKAVVNGRAVTANAIINVSSPTYELVLRAEPKMLELGAGNSQKIRVAIYKQWSSGLSEPVLGNMATFYWRISDTNIATVEGGLVKAGPLPGDATITASAHYLGKQLSTTIPLIVTREEHELPVVKIEPYTILLQKKEEKVLLKATVDGLPVEVKWSSSKPEEIDVIDGYAVAKADVGSALITAELVRDIKHVPAVATAMIAKLSSELVEVPDQYVTDLSFSTEEEFKPINNPVYDEHSPMPNAMLRLDSSYLKGRKMPNEGDILSNFGKGSIKVTSVMTSGDEIVVKGQLPKLNEIFDELDVDFTSENIGNYVKKVESLSGRNFLSESTLLMDQSGNILQTSEASNEARSQVKCEFRIDWDTISNTALRFKIKNKQVLLFSLISTLKAEANITLLDFKYSLKCKAPLFKPRAITGLVIAPYVTFVPQLYAEGFVQFAAEGDFDPDSEFISPLVNTTLGGSGGIVYQNQQATLQSSIDPFDLDADMNMISEFFGDSTLTASASIGMDGGILTSILPGPFPIPAGSTGWDNFSLLDIKAPMARIKASRSVTVPSQAIVPQRQENYQGMDGKDSLEGQIFILREVSPGGFIKFILKLMGVEGSPSLVIPDPAFNLFSIENHWPQVTDFTTPAKNVYIGGFDKGHPLYESYPKSIDLEATISRWNEQLIPAWADPWQRMEIWRRPSGSGSDFSPFISDLRSSKYTYTPKAGEEGVYDLRAQIYYFPFINGMFFSSKPSVSPILQQVNVKSMPKLALSPNPIDHVQFPNTTQRYDFKVSNLSSSHATYTFEESLPWLEAPQGDINIEANGVTTHSLQLTCPNRIDDFVGILNIRNTLTDEVSSVNVYLSCRALIFDPRSQSVSASVGQHVTLSFDIKNNVNQSVQTTNSLPGFSLNETISLFAPNSTKTLSASRECKSKGTTNHVLSVDAYGYTHTANITLECKDPGQSAGDPHLYSFDRTKFDFQAKGEFVLARLREKGSEDDYSPSSIFEVQARQVEWGSRQVTVNKAVAMNVHGDRLGFYELSHIPDQGGRVMLNGVKLDLAPGAVRLLSMENGSSIQRLSNTQYLVSWENGASATVTIHRRFLNLALTPPSVSSTHELVGVLGNFDGNPDNDFKLRDGTQLPPKPSFAEFYNCVDHPCFAYDETNGWLIRTIEESLFDYIAGDGPLSFAPEPGIFFPFKEHKVSDFDEQGRTWAEKVCRNSGVKSAELLDSCMLDLLLTNDPNFAESIADMETSEVAPLKDGAARSCKQLRSSGIYQSGDYVIDTDGDGPNEPVTVYCDMTTGEGGWTFKYIADGKPTRRLTDDDSCKDHGLQLFAPRSKDDYAQARDYMLMTHHVNDGLGPLGIYHPKSGNEVIAKGLNMHTYSDNSAAQEGWLSTAGPDWWATDIITTSAGGEPNGDYTAKCWLDWRYDSDGNVHDYNDNYCKLEYSRYMCIHKDNLNLEHTNRSL